MKNPADDKTCPGCGAWPEDCECAQLDEMFYEQLAAAGEPTGAWVPKGA